MYKVFFKDRIVFFSNDFSGAIKNNDGLFYKFGNEEALKTIVKAYFYLDSVPALYLIHDDIEFIWAAFKRSFRILEAAGGMVFNNKGELLIIKRNGVWDLPKGKLEKNEKPKEAALREVSEECGITGLKIESFLTTSYHCYELKKDLILKPTSWYRMKYEGDELPSPQEEENITSAIWIQPEEISYITGNSYKSLNEVFKASGYL